MPGGYLSSLEDDRDLYAPPPTLPPRATNLAAPSPYPTSPAPTYSYPQATSPSRPLQPSNNAGTHPLQAISSTDPRSSSQQSLSPEDASQDDGRRKLLVVYIHGFMGNETSFQSFPAHVHNVLTVTMSDTHAVHSKIYPRYKSRKQIAFASEEFSSWLAPHTNEFTDVVLVGHSMGGLLAAEIALLPPNPANGKLFRHRILGVINFDVPFLGMHPGVISAGLGSIFRSDDKKDSKPAETSVEGSSNNSLTSPSVSTLSTTTSSISETMDQATTPSRTNTLSTPPSNDPNYNPTYSNDINLPVRKGWGNLMHFLTKHSKDLREASKNAIKQHVEFGSAMADYGELKARYAKVRALEEENDGKRREQCKWANGLGVPRVRFVNYYTASTGRVKKPKSPKAGSPSQSAMTSPGASTEQLDRMESLRLEDSATTDSSNGSDPTTATTKTPTIPPEPVKPTPLDPSAYDDEESWSTASREYFQQVKTWKQAVADREQALAKQASQPSSPEATTPSIHGIKDSSTLPSNSTASTPSLPMAHPSPTPTSTAPTSTQPTDKPKKDRKFCMLPPKDDKGNRDPTWVRVLMVGMDEVSAHCGLFFLGETYERLVGDTAGRIEGWVMGDGVAGQGRRVV